MSEQLANRVIPRGKHLGVQAPHLECGFHDLSSLKTTSALPCAGTRGGVQGTKPGTTPWINSSRSQEQAVVAAGLVSSCHAIQKPL